MKKRFFRDAEKESHLSDYRGQHLGCVAVYADKFILARSHNMEKTSTSQYIYNKYRVDEKPNIMEKPAKTHSEISVLSKIKYLDPKVLSKTTLYVYRQLKNGDIALAKPCKACARAMRDLGIARICYTTPDGYIEERFYKEN